MSEANPALLQGPGVPHALRRGQTDREGMGVFVYLARLKASKVALWCYFIWYVALTARYFDPSPAIWLNALGISIIIGVALWLGIRSPDRPPDRWQVRRLFLTPFCVSSFSALIKGKGFILIFPPSLAELLLAAGACLAFVAMVGLVKRLPARDE